MSVPRDCNMSLPVESVPHGRAEEHFGWLARFAALDMPASSEATRSTTGWAPREQKLLESLHDAGYFEGWARGLASGSVGLR
ncbi:MAG: hypothetical protein AAF560_13670 [Acidobacteriota bacterium]